MLILSGLYRNAQSPPCEDTNCINRVHRDACSDANRMTNYAGQAIKQGGVTVLGVGVLQSLGWGVTVLGVGVLQSLGGGQQAHLITGRTWLFCFVWGGGRPQLRGGGVWAPCQLGPALPQLPPCLLYHPNTRCTRVVGPAPQWLQSTAQT